MPFEIKKYMGHMRAWKDIISTRDLILLITHAMSLVVARPFRFMMMRG